MESDPNEHGDTAGCDEHAVLRIPPKKREEPVPPPPPPTARMVWCGQPGLPGGMSQPACQMGQLVSCWQGRAYRNHQLIARRGFREKSESPAQKPRAPSVGRIGQLLLVFIPVVA